MEIIPYNGTTLAFIGDAIMTLKVRIHLVERGYQKPNDLQKMTAKWVSAKAQAKYLVELSEVGFFTEEEMSVIKRGRNAQTKTIAKNADVLTYRLATGLEAVFGYFYLSEQNERLEELWQRILEIGAIQ